MFFISQNVFTPTIEEDMEVILKKLGEAPITVTEAQVKKLQNGEAIMMLTWDKPSISASGVVSMSWYLVTGILFIENKNSIIIHFNNGNADGNEYQMESEYVTIQG